MLDIEALLRETAKGDEQAFARLYRRFHPPLVGWLLEQTNDRMAAEDLAQIAWLQVWRHARNYDPRRGTFLNWLWAIAKRRMWTWRRREALRRSLWVTHSDRLPGDGAAAVNARSPDDPEQMYEVRAGARRLGIAYAALPEKWRAAVHAYDVRGQDYYEAAAALGCPLGTLKSRLSRGRERLYAALT